MKLIKTVLLLPAVVLVTTAEKCDPTAPTPAMKYIIEFAPPANPLEALQSSAYADRMRASVRSGHGLMGPSCDGSSGRLPYDICEDLTPEQIKQLEADPRVKKVHRNTYRAIQTEQSLKLIEQPKAYSWGATGKGYAVAILDTGADWREPDLGSCEQPGPQCRVAMSLDMTAQDDGEADADPDKHGTNVAAIVAKVAPEASIISLDVFERNGAADSDVIKALNWIIINRGKYGIVAVNMSLGSPKNHQVSCKNSVYDSAFEWLLRDSIQVVVAAGNEGVKTGLSEPACHPYAIAVGATTDAATPATGYPACKDPNLSVDAVTCFSNSAESIDILAPGTNIDAGGRRMSGTSQAAPHVTGALAALKSKFPGRSTGDLLLRLQQTGVPVTDRLSSITTRRINMASAMNDRPVANDDSVVVLQGGGAVIDVLANDRDESPQSLKIAGVYTPGTGDTVLVARNKIFVLMNPATTGSISFRYTVKDEYGDSDVGTVKVIVRPSQFPTSRRVVDESTLISRLGKSGAWHYLVYESETFAGRSVWFQPLKPDGTLDGGRYNMSGSNSGTIQPNDLRLAFDDHGLTASWLTDAAGKTHVMAVNYRLPVYGTPYMASFNYQSVPGKPTVAVLGDASVIGWETSWNPTRLFAQATSREVTSPVPQPGPQEVSAWIAPSAHNETITLDAKKYLHLRTSGKAIEVRRLDALGKADWPDAKKLFEWSSDGAPPEFDHIVDFSSVRTPAGFALALGHARYAGLNSVSFREFDNNAIAVGNTITVLSDRSAQGDVNLLRFDDGTYRVFWWESYPAFGVLLSARITQDGKVTPPLVEYWTLDPKSFAPYMFDSMNLGDKYVLSWSNDARRLMMITRERL